VWAFCIICLIQQGIQSLAAKVSAKPRFLYGELGRWEIKLMQQAIKLLQGEDYRDGVQLGRQLFATSRKTTG